MDWIRSRQAFLVAAITGTLSLLPLFEVVGWSGQQVAALNLVATAWIAVVTGRNVESQQSIAPKR